MPVPLLILRCRRNGNEVGIIMMSDAVETATNKEGD